MKIRVNSVLFGQILLVIAWVLSAPFAIIMDSLSLLGAFIIIVHWSLFIGVVASIGYQVLEHIDIITKWINIKFFGSTEEEENERISKSKRGYY